jgi:hypothetical protein
VEDERLPGSFRKLAAELLRDAYPDLPEETIQRDAEEINSMVMDDKPR